MRWALITHPQQWKDEKLLQEPMEILESCIPAAQAQGWIVVARDSDFLDATVRIENNEQSNPRRIADHGEA